MSGVMGDGGAAWLGALIGLGAAAPLTPQAVAWLSLALAGPLAVACMATDLSRMRIPNGLTGALALAFLPVALLGLAPEAVAWRLAGGALVLGVGLALFATGRMGAGDGKMLAAGALWVAPWQAGQALMLLSLALLAGLAVVHGARAALAGASGGPPAWRGLRRGARFPMGVSIGAALIAHLVLAVRAV